MISSRVNRFPQANNKIRERVTYAQINSNGSICVVTKYTNIKVLLYVPFVSGPMRPLVFSGISWRKESSIPIRNEPTSNKVVCG